MGSRALWSGSFAGPHPCPFCSSIQAHVEARLGWESWPFSSSASQDLQQLCSQVPGAVDGGQWGALEEKPAAPSSLVATALVAKGLLPWLLCPPGPWHVFPFRSRSGGHLLCSLSSGCITAVWLHSVPWPTRPAPCIQCPPSKCSAQRVSQAGPRWHASLHLPPRSRSPPLASPALPLHGLLFSSAASCSFPSDSGQGQSSTCGSSRASTQVWEGQKHYVHLDA